MYHKAPANFQIVVEWSAFWWYEPLKAQVFTENDVMSDKDKSRPDENTLATPDSPTYARNSKVTLNDVAGKNTATSRS